MKHLRVPFVTLTAVAFTFAAASVARADVAPGPSEIAVAGALGMGALTAIGLVVAVIVIASFFILRRIVRARQVAETPSASAEDRRAS